jgi:hypothetical protein
MLAELEELSRSMSDIEIGLKWGIGYSLVRHHRKRLGIPSYTERTGNLKSTIDGSTRRRGTHNQLNSDSIQVNFFREIDCPEKAYWIGLLAADGCVSENSRISLSQAIKDREIVDAFSAAIGATHLVKERKVQSQSFLGKSKQTHMAIVRITSKTMASDLAREGIIKRKSLTIQISPCSERYPSAYIRGLLDGDGSVGEKNFHFSGGSESHITEIRDLIFSQTGCLLTQSYTLSQDTNRGVWRLQGTKKDQTVLEWIYQDLESTPYLKRKYLRFSRFWLEREQRKAERLAQN